MQACTEYEQIGGTIERSKHHHLPIFQQSHAKPCKAMQSHAKNKPFMQDQHGHPGQTSRTNIQDSMLRSAACIATVFPSLLPSETQHSLRCSPKPDRHRKFRLLLVFIVQMYVSVRRYVLYIYPAYTLLYSTFTLHTLHICN